MRYFVPVPRLAVELGPQSRPEDKLGGLPCGSANGFMADLPRVRRISVASGAIRPSSDQARPRAGWARAQRVSVQPLSRNVCDVGTQLRRQCMPYF